MNQDQAKAIKELCDAIDRPQSDKPVIIPYSIAEWILKVKKARESIK